MYSNKLMRNKFYKMVSILTRYHLTDTQKETAYKTLKLVSRRTHNA